jgi:hypothetical protein
MEVVSVASGTKKIDQGKSGNHSWSSRSHENAVKRRRVQMFSQDNTRFGPCRTFSNGMILRPKDEANETDLDGRLAEGVPQLVWDRLSLDERTDSHKLRQRRTPRLKSVNQFRQSIRELAECVRSIRGRGLAIDLCPVGPMVCVCLPVRPLEYFLGSAKPRVCPLVQEAS